MEEIKTPTDNNVNMSLSATVKKSWARYYGVVISGLLFLILDATVFFFNFYISEQVEENAIRVNLAGRQSALIQEITKTLLQIQLI